MEHVSSVHKSSGWINGIDSDKKEKLLALRNARIRVIQDIIGIPPSPLLRELRYERDYFENLNPKKDSSREITFTQEGVRRLLMLVGNKTQRDMINWSSLVIPEKKDFVIDEICTLDFLRTSFWFKMYSWTQAVQTRPLWFGGGARTGLRPYVREEHFDEALELILSFEEKPATEIEARIAMPTRYRSFKRV